MSAANKARPEGVAGMFSGVYLVLDIFPVIYFFAVIDIISVIDFLPVMDIISVLGSILVLGIIPVSYRKGRWRCQ